MKHLIVALFYVRACALQAAARAALFYIIG